MKGIYSDFIVFNPQSDSQHRFGSMLTCTSWSVQASWSKFEALLIGLVFFITVSTFCCFLVVAVAAVSLSLSNQLVHQLSELMPFTDAEYEGQQFKYYCRLYGLEPPGPKNRRGGMRKKPTPLIMQQTATQSNKLAVWIPPRCIALRDIISNYNVPQAGTLRMILARYPLPHDDALVEHVNDSWVFAQSTP